MNVRRQQAEIYIAPDGRRSLTAESAYRRAARLELIATEGPCECDGPDYLDRYPGHTCNLHDGSKEQEIVAIMRRMKQEDREEAT